MNEALYRNHLSILREELVVAMGCTEPIAIAYAGAKAKQVLGAVPDHCHVKCSGNIVKNVKGVTVPTSEGMRGIEIAATLGVVGGDPERELAVLQTVTHEDLLQARELLKNGFCTCELIEGVANLYIIIELTAGEQSALVEIKDHHANITRIIRNGEVLLEVEDSGEQSQTDGPDRFLLDVRNIIEFADSLAAEDVSSVLEPQILCNTAIAQEGLTGAWGAAVGKTLLEREENPSVLLRAKAMAAAGSDARMSGCAMPVVINSGSGNQGITVTLPVVEYARELGVTDDMRFRALAVANLISVHQKKYIGSLSAYCGAVSAACGAACGVAYMMYKGKVSDDELYRIISDTITNSICTAGGIVCDGAKSSCAAKIAASVEVALTALELSGKNRVFQPGEGLVMDQVEDTIAAVGRMARDGMKSTDIEILNIMLGN